MSTKKRITNKKRPGPKPQLISLHPFTFDEVLDTVLTSKPKKAQKGQGKEMINESSANDKD